MDLSIIMPGCNEHPQSAFTIANVITTMEPTGVDYEILYIDNMSTVEKHWLDNKARHRLKVHHYDQKQSHWCAKNVGIQNARADVMFFMDAHCVLEPNALANMYRAYVDQYSELNGSLHMPINYLLEIPGRELVYKQFYSKPDGILHYSFTRLRTRDRIHKVPSMSCCGVMISKEILVDAMGMWPWSYGIYGGGENFLNFVQGVLGYDKNIWPFNPIHHYAYKRGYSWTYDNFCENHIIAAYMWGGEEWVDRYIEGRVRIKGDKKSILKGFAEKLLPECREQREHIKSQQKYTPEEWVAKMHKELPEYFAQYEV